MIAPLQKLELDGACPWVEVNKNHRGARELADRHYSRQTPGAPGFLPPGRTLVLVTRCGRAVWGVCENVDPAGVLRFRVTIFRNEGAGLSSSLISSATTRTLATWQSRHGIRAPLRTEVDASRVRAKRDPGRCFRRAGWRFVGETAGGHGRRRLLVFEAPTASPIDTLDRPLSARVGAGTAAGA